VPYLQYIVNKYNILIIYAIITVCLQYTVSFKRTEMGLKENIGQILKSRRNELDMSQSDMCDYSEIGPTTLSNIENGKTNFTIDNLENILEVLGLELQIRVKGMLDDNSESF